MPFSKNGFYPLYYNSWEADIVSPQHSSHTHQFNGCVFYMPNGLVLNETYYHGNFYEKEFSVGKTIASTVQLSMFRSALAETDLLEMLSKHKNYTVFAPTNEAWLRLPEKFVKRLFTPEYKQTLMNILEYHIIGTRLKTLGHGGFITLEGNTIQITSKNACVYFVNNIPVKSRVPEAKNGFVYLIDHILLPPDLEVEEDEYG